jgi:hypothetical protein
MIAAFGSGKSLADFLTTSIELGCAGLEIEYRDGCTEITAMKGRFGFGIGELKSGTPESDVLIDELWSLRNRTKRIEVRGIVYKAKVTTFDSFGETAYRIMIRQGVKPRIAPRSCPQ